MRHAGTDLQSLDASYLITYNRLLRMHCVLLISFLKMVMTMMIIYLIMTILLLLLTMMTMMMMILRMTLFCFCC